VLTLEEPISILLIRFILNNKNVSTDLPPGNLLVDFIRYEQNLKGTKIGCREGDCGACVVLVGEVKNGELQYQSLTSCLTPLANVHNKHVVTIEGINMPVLNLIQQAMTDEAATQCGFCTPGFVMSFAGFCLSRKECTYENAIAAVDGNICRCTGYKSIERAAARITDALSGRGTQEPSRFAVDNNILPSYFSNIQEQIEKLSSATNGELQKNNDGTIISGGTDLYVQRHDELKFSGNRYVFDHKPLKGIYKEDGMCIMGASTTVTDLAESSVMQASFPKLNEYIKLISSTPIRNIATIAGNFINASPIGDLTIFFLALDATLVLSDGNGTRELPLRKLYRGYKILDKLPGEYIEKVFFELPGNNASFHFEKISKRTYLDIASVNTAISIKARNGKIAEVHLSAGGVAPVPLYMEETVAFLKAKPLSEETMRAAIEVIQTEISPISDVRGTENYKRLLLSQLFKAHFVELFNLTPSLF
jgi:xanthine dehydrogenase small subunit